MSIPRPPHPVVLLVAGTLAIWPAGVMAQTFIAQPQTLAPYMYLNFSHAIASAGPGNIIVAWWVTSSPPGIMAPEIRASHSFDWGATWAPATCIYTSPNMQWGYGLAIGADASGHAIAAWTKSTSSGPYPPEKPPLGPKLEPRPDLDGPDVADQRIPPELQAHD